MLIILAGCTVFIAYFGLDQATPVRLHRPQAAPEIGREPREPWAPVGTVRFPSASSAPLTVLISTVSPTAGRAGNSPMLPAGEEAHDSGLRTNTESGKFTLAPTLLKVRATC